MKKSFRTTIKDANQTITFCGVGSDKKIPIIERKIHTITLGAISLLLHEKIHLSKAITTTLGTRLLKTFAKNLCTQGG